MRIFSKKIQATLLVLAMGTFVISGCGEEKPGVKDTTDVTKVQIEGFNKELAKYPVEGFDYKGANPSTADWDAKAKQMLPYVKTLITNMPKGYVIEVRGHTDASGPEQPVGNKKGNIWWSEQRANGVKDALVRQGIPAEKLVARGVGSSELIPDAATTKTGRSKLNRRVTFHVVEQK